MGTNTRIVGIAAALFAAPAQARTSVNLSIGVPLGGYGYVQPGYAYTQPSYVYTQPSYVYSQPSYGYTQPYVYTQPNYVYTQPNFVYYGGRQYHNGGHRYYTHNRGWRGDRDHDGVPNRFDRRPDNPYRR